MRRSLVRSLALWIGCACFFGLSGCQPEASLPQRKGEGQNMNRAKIRIALEALLRRDNGDAFVIFEEKRTGKFVQFCGSARDDLFLDLPSQTLDQAQSLRADDYFAELGVRAEEYDMLDGPGGKVVGRQRSFQKKLGRDVETAATIAERIFERVYQFPADFDLIVKEN